MKAAKHEDWPRLTVAEIMSSCSADNTITPDSEAMQAITKMSQHDNSRLMVVQGTQLVGIVTLKDLTEFITLKLELEGEGTPASRRPLPTDLSELRDKAPQRHTTGTSNEHELYR
ncbi:MAG: hypothetical protein CMJ64_28765 [Planctomycetaceae bacterium]|nr:hypothetical protein [Planctomycetaceae bacterium]